MAQEEKSLPLDTRKLMTGKDGKCFVEFDGVNYFLAEVDSFVIDMTVTNIDTQPVGSLIHLAVPSGVSFSLKLSEMVVRDDLILKPIMEQLKMGKFPTFNFQAAATSPDGKVQRIMLTDCIPDGEFDLMTLVPGEIIKRVQSYRINKVPEWLDTLAGINY